VRLSRVKTVLGEEIARDEIVSILASIGFVVTENRDSLDVTVPSWRSDVISEIEVIEEIARLHGYDQFSAEIRPFRPGTVPDAPLELLSRRLRRELNGAGLLEARPMPFVRNGPDDLRVRNPLAEDEAYLRRAILDTLARRVEYNFAHMQRNVRLYEIGAVFRSGETAESGAPAEHAHVAAVIAGDRNPPHFTNPKPAQFDEWDAKEIAHSLATIIWESGQVTLAPGRGDALWTIEIDGKAVGGVTRLQLDAPVWAPPVYGIEIDIDAVPRREVKKTSFAGVPAMPAMQVDLALIVPDSVSAQQVDESIRATAGELLESLEIFDEFRGKGIPEGTRSLGWALTFRHPERTLRDKEIQGRTSKILGNLEAKFGIRRRTS
jgi:phenylalanyl-tRNA synthetase beta chain